MSEARKAVWVEDTIFVGEEDLRSSISHGFEGKFLKQRGTGSSKKYWDQRKAFAKRATERFFAINAIRAKREIDQIIGEV